MNNFVTPRIQSSAKKINKITYLLKNKTIDQIKYILCNMPQKVAKILYKQILNWEKAKPFKAIKYTYINMLKPIKRLEYKSRGRMGLKTKPFSKIYVVTE